MKIVRLVLSVLSFAVGVAVLGVLVWFGYKVGMWFVGK